MNKTAKKILIGLLIIFVIIQLIPANRPDTNTDLSNDLITTENVPDEVAAILHKACYDCHSNQTRYPWYSYVAPVSWLVAKDTREGREELNFSEWNTLSKRKKIKILDEMGEEVEEGEMPMKIYTVIHRDANLSDQERETLINWTKEQTNKLLGGG